MSTQSEFERQIASIEGAVHAMENAADPALSSKARELVQALMSLHGACLERMLEIVHQTGALGESIIDSFSRDEKVRSLLVLYGIHPLSLEARVRQGLEKAAPYLRSHAAKAELLGVDDAGAVRVRVEAGANGCPSTAGTLKSTVEQAVRELAPDVTAIQFEGSAAEHRPALAFVPLSALQAEAAISAAASSLAGRGGK